MSVNRGTLRGMTTNTLCHFEPFQPADAEQVTRLFVEVYGDAYPIRRVYDPQQLIQAAQSGTYFPFVARTDEGRVVSYAALCQSAPFKGIYELVQGIVSSDFRGGGIGRAMFEHVEHLLTTLPGAETYFGESVCNHLYTQKTSALIKSIETGLEVDLMPGAVYANDTPDTGRIAVLDGFRTFVSKPHHVYLPQAYEEIIRYIYDGFDDHRTLSVAADIIPEGEQTELSIKLFEQISVGRLALTSVGSDLEEVLSTHERALAQQQTKVLQLWVPSTWPWLGSLVDRLRARGYFFGGVFPRWFDDDAIMLQKLSGQPNWEGIKLYSDRAQNIRNAVYADWLQTRQHRQAS